MGRIDFAAQGRACARAMVPHVSGRAWLLRELRRVEWRRLLLACALLAVWARLLVPMAAHAAPVAAGGMPMVAICTPSGEEWGQRDVPATIDHEDRVCPFCRVGEPEMGLAPSPGVRDLPAPALQLRAPPLSPAAVTLRFHAHPRPRGPPGPIATL